MSSSAIQTAPESTRLSRKRFVLLDFSRLSIFQKGLILIGLPLISELLFVSILVTLQMKAEQNAENLTRSKAIITSANNIPRALVEGASALVVYKLSQSELAEERFESSQKKVDAELAQLSKICAHDKNRKAKVENLRAVLQRGEKALLEMRDAIAGGKESYNSWRSYHPSSEMTGLLKSVSSAVADLVSQEQLRDRSQMLSRSRQGVVVWLVIGVAANVVLAIGLLMFLAAEICNRLSVVSENSLRLSQKKQLQEPLGGDDEIAKVDATFHQMAQALEEAAIKEAALNKELERKRNEYVAMLTHDLRTPLTSIGAFLEGVVDGIYDERPEAMLDRAESAKRQVSRLIGLVSDMLNVEKAEAGMLNLKKAQTSVKALAEKACNSTAAIAAAKKVLLVQPEADIVVPVDAELFVRVLENLISNAIKFSPEGASVRITAEELDGHVEISVHDEGPGIPEGEAETIFEKFQQSSQTAVKGGTGLGLTFCKLVASAHGGTICALPGESGRGSRFTVRLPL